MTRAGLAELAPELLRAAVADEETVARFCAKIVTRGSDCTLMCSGAVSGEVMFGIQGQASTWD